VDKAYLIKVYGRVQRVGFRRFALDIAQELKLAGYVKNLEDGSVELFIQGDEEKLKYYIEKIRNAPQPIKVDNLVVEEQSYRSEIKFFKIIYGELPDELQEGFGSMQTIFMNYWDEFKDYRSEFRDYRNEFKDFRNEFKDFRNEFKDFRNEFKDFRNEFKDFRKEFQDYRSEFREFAERTDDNFKLLIGMSQDILNKLINILELIEKDSKETRLMLNETMKILKEVLLFVSKK
jgi:Acylphosphatases